MSVCFRPTAFAWFFAPVQLTNEDFGPYQIIGIVASFLANAIPLAVYWKPMCARRERVWCCVANWLQGAGESGTSRPHHQFIAQCRRPRTCLLAGCNFTVYADWRCLAAAVSPTVLTVYAQVNTSTKAVSSIQLIPFRDHSPRPALSAYAAPSETTAISVTAAASDTAAACYEDDVEVSWQLRRWLCVCEFLFLSLDSSELVQVDRSSQRHSILHQHGRLGLSARRIH